MVNSKLVNLKVEDILPSEGQPRQLFDPYELKLLGNSIKENGLLQPLIVRPDRSGKYRLVAGERRLRAARLAGLKKLPCIIKKTDDLTADIYTLTENLRQEKLTAFEEAEGISRIINTYKISPEAAATRLGISNSCLSDKLLLLSISEELKAQLTAARLTERHARALLRIEPDRRKQALDYILANQLTFTEAEHYVDTLLCPIQKDTAAKPRCAIGDLRLFSNSLLKMVETLKQGGVNATARKDETETHIEYIVAIEK